uniref:CUB domain-containing protein n=1 Tax=Panagrolaimus sp. PS1159 TaxID=55785 RepID=A0AC35F5I3_9BILA
MFLFLLFFSNFFIFQTDGGYATAECSSNSPIKTQGIHSNDFLYFYSPDFPKSLSNRTQTFPCGINLAAADKDNRIWFAMLNGELNEIDLIDYSFNETIHSYNSNYDIIIKLSTTNYLYFQIPESFSRQKWIAFEAIALAYDPKLNLTCPFSKQTIDFSINPELVIPITSDFAPNSSYTFKACNWNFIVNSTQQLKVVVKKLNPSSDFILNLFADGNFAQNFNVSVNYVSTVHYFDGENFNLTFTNQWSNSSLSNFFFLISAVSETDTFTNDRCKNAEINGTLTTFSNINYEKGYPKNQECNYTISIPKNHEAAFVLDENHIEISSDILTINNQTLDTQRIIFPYYYTLLQASNGALLTFKSDGNTQGAGFIAALNTYGNYQIGENENLLLF